MAGDFELEFDIVTIGEQAFDASEIIIAQNDRGDRRGSVVAAMLLGDDDAIGTGMRR